MNIMNQGTYYDSERRKLVPNSLQVLKERFFQFKTACQITINDYNSKDWWPKSQVKSKADSLLNHLDHILISMEVNESFFARYLAMKACVMYEAGVFLIKKSATKHALQLLKKTLDMLCPLLPVSEVYWLYFQALAEYAEVMKEKGMDSVVIPILEDAIEMYESKGVPTVLYTSGDLFSLYFRVRPNKFTRESLEKTVTKHYQLLIAMYINNLDVVKYLRSEHFLLKREMKMKTMVPHDWIGRAVVLAKILITGRDFRNARHHLAVATTEYKAMYKQPTKTAEEKTRLRNVQEALSSAWIKYGLSLLIESKDAMMFKYSQGDASTKQGEEAKEGDEEPKKSDVNVLVESYMSQHSVKLLPDIAGEDGSLDVTQEENEAYEDGSSIIDTALLLHSQDTRAGKLTEALSKSFYVDLRFPGRNRNEIEKLVPRSLIDKPEEAAKFFLFLLPWIDMFKKIIHTANNPLQHAKTILELNELFKNYAFFQPNPVQQYEIHKERQSDLELLAWMLKRVGNQELLPTELEVTRELSMAHFQLTQMNLNRVKELAKTEVAVKSVSEELLREVPAEQQGIVL